MTIYELNNIMIKINGMKFIPHYSSSIHKENQFGSDFAIQQAILLEQN